MRSISLLVTACLVLLLVNAAWAQGTAFTYQGRLTDANTAANGLYDFQFKLYATANDSNVLGTVTVDDVNVTNGVFTVQLDFGATPFANNAAQFLEICVRLGNQTGVYTTLTPRQRVNATPYALKSMIANDALQLNGVAASQFVQTNDTRLSDARTPTAGSGNYIQNGAALQAASNFNISGNGTAGGTLSGNVVNATTQFNLGGARILGRIQNNLFVGRGAGANLSSLSGNNTFVGEVAGRFTTDGYTNTFIGTGAGYENTFGNYNVYVGVDAGAGRTVESQNTLLGTFTKAAPGVNNAVAIGFQAEVHQSDSIVLGYGATRVGIGTSAPQARLHVVGNARVDGDLAVSGTLNATVNNALQLGGVAANQYVQTSDARLTDDRNPKAGSANYIQNGIGQQAASNFHISGNGTAGGTLSGNLVNAQTQFNLNNERILSANNNDNTLAVGLNSGTGGLDNATFGMGAGNTNTGNSSAFFGTRAGVVNSGNGNSFFGADAGQRNTSGTKNAFFGHNAGLLNQTGSENAFFGSGAGLGNSASNNAFFGAQAGSSNLGGAENVFLGRSAGRANQEGSENVFVGAEAGSLSLNSSGNVFAGRSAGITNQFGSNNTILGFKADVAYNTIGNATAVGARARVDCPNCLVLGGVNGINGATATVNTGIGTTNPAVRLHIKHDSLGTNGWGVFIENSAQPNYMAAMRLSDSGFFEVSNAALTGSRYARLDGNGNWTAVSDRRLKTAIQPVQGLLAGALKLRPVSYEFLPHSARQIGFIAQEVAEVFPSLVLNGEVQTLNYAGLSVVAIGAVQEQQQQLTALQQQLAATQTENSALRALLRDLQTRLTRLEHQSPSASRMRLRKSGR